MTFFVIQQVDFNLETKGVLRTEKRHPHHEKVQQREEPIAIVKIHYKTHVFISKRHFIIIWQ